MIDWWYKFDSVESLMEYVSRDECEEGDVVLFKTADDYNFILVIGKNAPSKDRYPDTDYYTTVLTELRQYFLTKRNELEKIYQKISEDMKEEPLESLIKPDITPKLLVPVKPMERLFPDIEIKTRRWFEEFDREMRRRKRNYINKANPKKGSANYETQRIRNTEQIVHRQHRCQDR